MTIKAGVYHLSQIRHLALSRMDNSGQLVFLVTLRDNQEPYQDHLTGQRGSWLYVREEGVARIYTNHTTDEELAAIAYKREFDLYIAPRQRDGLPPIVPAIGWKDQPVRQDIEFDEVLSHMSGRHLNDELALVAELYDLTKEDERIEFVAIVLSFFKGTMFSGPGRSSEAFFIGQKKNPGHKTYLLYRMNEISLITEPVDGVRKGHSFHSSSYIRGISPDCLREEWPNLPEEVETNTFDVNRSIPWDKKVPSFSDLVKEIRQSDENARIRGKLLDAEGSSAHAIQMTQLAMGVTAAVNPPDIELPWHVVVMVFKYQIITALQEKLAYSLKEAKDWVKQHEQTEDPLGHIRLVVEELVKGEEYEVPRPNLW